MENYNSEGKIFVWFYILSVKHLKQLEQAIKWAQFKRFNTMHISTPGAGGGERKRANKKPGGLPSFKPKNRTKLNS